MLYKNALTIIQWLFSVCTTFFGILSPTPVVEYNVAGLVAGCFGGAVGAVNMRALVKGLGNELQGSKAARQDMNSAICMAWLIGWTLAYFSSDWECISGSFGAAWLAFFLFLTLGYLNLVNSEWDQFRAELSRTKFQSDYGDKVDTVQGFLFVLYGITMFLTTTLHLGFMLGFAKLLMSMFGMLSPVPDSFGFTLETFAAGAWGMGMAILHSYVLLFGVSENKDIAKVRRYSAIVFWCNTVVAWNKYPETGSFYTFWVTFSLFMAIYQIFLNYNVKLSEGSSGYESI